MTDDPITLGHALVKELAETWTSRGMTRKEFAIGALSAVLEMIEATPALSQADTLEVAEAAGLLFADLTKSLPWEQRHRIDWLVAQRIGEAK